MFTVLLLALSAGTALASDLTTTVNVIDPVPKVSDIGLYDARTNLPAYSMDPTQPYVLKMLVSDNNTLMDVIEIDVNISSATNPSAGWISSGNVNYKWVGNTYNEKGHWDRYNDADPVSFNTTWGLTSDSSQPVDMDPTSGLFTLGFSPGELAQYGSWSIRVRVKDFWGNEATGSLAAPVSMNKYIAMSVQDFLGLDKDTVDFGDVAPGGCQVSGFVTSVRTNDIYSLAASTAPFTSAHSSLTPVSAITGADQFVMSIDDSLNASTLVLVTPQVLPANPITGYASAPAPATGIGEAESPARTGLYLQLELSPQITAQEAYTGTVTVTASNN